MKFTIASGALLKELVALNPMISANPVVPILDNFLFDVGQEELVITASDLHTFVVAKVAIKSQDQLPIRVGVPARILLETLKSLPEQQLFFSVDPKTYTIVITWARGQYKLVGENAADYPHLPKHEEPMPWELPTGVLRRAIKKTLFVASRDDMRPALAGVHVSLDQEGAVFVATDGHRLARYIHRATTLPAHRAMTLPSKPLQLLLQLLPTQDEDKVVVASIASKSITFVLGTRTIITYLIDEPYPDYENVIPSLPPYCLNLPTQDFLQALKRVAIYANRTTHQLCLEPGAKQLKVFAEDLDFANEASETLNSTYEGEALRIGFNGKFLIELVGSLASERVNIRFEDPSKATLILPEGQPEGEDSLLLIMPVLLREPAKDDGAT